MACKLGITSVSLGRASKHNLRTKLVQASRHGIHGIELFFEDIQCLCELEVGPSSSSQNILRATSLTRELCDQNKLEVICVQPFWNYEGLKDRAEQRRRVKELQELWFPMARVLRTDIIQIPSNFLNPAELVEDVDTIVRDLTEVADLGLQHKPPLRFVYESLAWGTRVDTWDKCWQIVKQVDRPNFGICLDTFNIAGRVYADPARSTGKTINAEEDIATSIRRLKKDIDVRKVFYVQVVDAERLSKPMAKGHELYNPEQPARMTWSRNCRLFYREKDRGAYLPVRELASAIFKDLGFRGWVSLEYFNRDLAYDIPDMPEQLARRAAISWRKLSEDMGLGRESVRNGQVQASL